MLKKLSAVLLFGIISAMLAFGNLNAQPIPDGKLLKEVDAEKLREVIESYKGKKAVLVNLWATWCGPCVEEFPDIVKLQNIYEDRLQVIFVSADFEKEPAIRFLREQGVDWTTYFKTGKDQVFINSLSKKWTGAMPFTKIIDKQGNVVNSWESKAEFDRFEYNIKKAIKL